MNEHGRSGGVRPPARSINWAAPLGGLAVGVILIAITLSQGHGTPDRAAVGIGMCVAYTVALIALQLRSETVKTMVGRPIDERWALIHKNALAASSWIGIVAGLIAYAVVEVAGGENWQFAYMIVAISLGYLVSVFWYRAQI